MSDKDGRLGVRIIETLTTLFNFCKNSNELPELRSSINGLRFKLKNHNYCTDIMDLEISEEMLNNLPDTHDVYRFAYEIIDYFVYYTGVKNSDPSLTTEDIITIEKELIGVYAIMTLNKLEALDWYLF